MLSPDREAVFWSQVQKGDGCWLWLGAQSGSGYGGFSVRGVRRPAHRVAYELMVGPFPEDKQADHLCRQRLCVRPDHIEPVTGRENTLRGEGPTAQNARAEACVRGHPFTSENTYVKKGWRICRTCQRVASNAYRANRRATDSAFVARENVERRLRHLAKKVIA